MVRVERACAARARRRPPARAPSPVGAGVACRAAAVPYEAGGGALLVAGGGPLLELEVVGGGGVRADALETDPELAEIYLPMVASLLL